MPPKRAGGNPRAFAEYRKLDWLSLSRRLSLMLSGGARHAGVLAAAKPAHPEMWITAEERQSLYRRLGTRRGTSHLFARTPLMLLALVIKLTPPGTGSSCGGLNR